MMSSYGRIPEMLHQIRAMDAQSYKNTHLFVTVKGITEYMYLQLVVPNVRDLANAGKLSLCLTGNTNQFINLLDTIRGYDLDEYDLFLKIDDDDIYHRDYVKCCANAIQLCAPGTSTYYGGTPTVKTISQKNGTWVFNDTFKAKPFDGYGHMMGMGLPIIKHFFEVERKPTLLLQDTALVPWEDGMSIGWREDRYCFEMLRRLGPCVNIAPVCEKLGIVPSYIGGYTVTNSWTRSRSYRDSEFLKRVKSFKNNPHPPREYFIELEDTRVLRIFDGYYNLIGNDEKHRYISFKNGKLEMKNGRVYKRQADGRYAEVK